MFAGSRRAGASAGARRRGMTRSCADCWEYGEVAKRSNAADCKSVALAASKVRILPSPPAFARFASFGWASQDAERSLRSQLRPGRQDAKSRRMKVLRMEDSGWRRRSLPRRSCERSERVAKAGGSNSVVESQPSKLLVAGSIPVSRSNLRSWMQAKVAHRSARRESGPTLKVNELRLAGLR